MDKLVRDMMKNGKDINEILDMPYHYVLQILDERNQKKNLSEKEQEAILDAL